MAQPYMPDDATVVDRNQTSPIEFAGNDVGPDGCDPPPVQERSRNHLAHCVGLADGWYSNFHVAKYRTSKSNIF